MRQHEPDSSVEMTKRFPHYKTWLRPWIISKEEKIKLSQIDPKSKLILIFQNSPLETVLQQEKGPKREGGERGLESYLFWTKAVQNLEACGKK